MKTIYTCFCTDVIHEGHLHIIEEAHKYGAVIVGALSDRALIRCMRFPTIPFEERVRLYEGLDGVDRVVVQDDMLYDDILAELKPDYVIHGDNWRTGPEAVLRESAIRALAQYGGELIEAPYTVNEEVRKIDLRLKEKLAHAGIPAAAPASAGRNVPYRQDHRGAQRTDRADCGKDRGRDGRQAGSV